jgi:hypothetical protein
MEEIDYIIFQQVTNLVMEILDGLRKVRFQDMIPVDIPVNGVQRDVSLYFIKRKWFLTLKILRICLL